MSSVRRFHPLAAAGTMACVLLALGSSNGVQTAAGFSGSEANWLVLSTYDIPAGNTIVFSDDFSANPNSSGQWSLHRYASDASAEGVWDGTDGIFYLLKASPNKGLAMFANYALTAHRWDAYFKYKIGGGDEKGADGLVFLFYKDAGSYGRPSFGGDLAFQLPGNVPVKGYGVAFDGFQNSNHNDPFKDFVGLLRDSVDGHVGSFEEPRVEDNQQHIAHIRFDDGRVGIAIDADPPRLVTIPNPDYTYSGVGFSAGTGSDTNNHIIDNFMITIPAQ